MVIATPLWGSARSCSPYKMYGTMNARGPSRPVSVYEILKSTAGFPVDFGFLDFWISKWISGFQSGFLDIKVDFYISKWILGFVWKIIICYPEDTAHEQWRLLSLRCTMSQALHSLPLHTATNTSSWTNIHYNSIVCRFCTSTERMSLPRPLLDIKERSVVWVVSRALS